MSVYLKLLLPSGVVLKEKVAKITAEAENGFFTLLPRHVDFVSALVPGIFSYVNSAGEEHFYALDEGILVKQGENISVSVNRAVYGDNLEILQETVTRELKALDENEKKARSVMSKLEIDTLKRFTRLGGE